MPLKTTKALDKAHWLWSDDERHNRYLGFHKRIALKSSGKVSITLFADLHYKLYVNGQFVNAGPAPFQKPVIMADTYDITDYCQKGGNDIFIMCHWLGTSVKYNTCERPGVVAAIKSAGADVLTDDSWSVYSLDAWQEKTPKKNWAIGFAEVVDTAHASMNVLKLFASEDYARENDKVTLSSIKRLAKKPTTYQRSDLIVRERMVPYLAWSDHPPLRVSHIYRTNTEVYRIADTMRYDNEHLVPATDNLQYHMLREGDVRFTRMRGEKGYGIVYDMGAMMAGDYSIEIDVSADCTMDIQHVETLRDERPYGTRMGSMYTSRFALKKGSHRLRLYNFTGYRFLYVAIRDLEGECVIHNVLTHRCVGDVHYCDTVGTPDETLNHIYDISRRSVVLNTQAFAYDCNTREQGAYWGDGIWIVDSVGHMSGDFAYMKHLCYAMTDEFDAFGRIHGSLFSENNHPLYDYCLVPHDVMLRYYQYTGDLKTIKENLHTCEAILAQFRAGTNKQGVVEMAKMEENPVFKDSIQFIDHPGTTWHPQQTTAIDRRDPSVGLNLFYLKALQCTHQLLKICSKRSILASEISALKKTILAKGFDKECGLLRDSLASECEGYSQIVNCLGIMTGVLEGDAAQYAFKTILDVKRNPWVSQGTPYTYFFIAEAAAMLGQTEAGVHTMKEHWQPMLDRGATTTWEAFGGENHDSLNHAWSAPLPYLVHKGIVGLSPLSPGYKALQLAPCLTTFDAFDCQVAIPQGTITLSWQRQTPSTVAVDISLPAKVKGKLKIGKTSTAITKSFSKTVKG